MGEYHIGHRIYSLTGSKRSVDEQISISNQMWLHGIGPSHEGLKRKEIEPELGLSLSFKAKTSLGHLVRAGIVERDPHDYEDLMTYVIAQWMGSDGEIVNGEVNETATDAIDALISHMNSTDPSGRTTVAATDGGPTIRSVLSRVFRVAPDEVEARLRAGDRVENIRSAVPAIVSNPDLSTRNDYGMLTFRNQAYRYRLTPEATALYRL